MSNPIIKVENLSKSYIIGHESRERYTTLRDQMARKARSWFSFGTKEKIKHTTEEFWALKDINFEISQGDRVGIIGRNGAGKSTLLKILSRITEPTTGKIAMNGRVASLLEVGTGFHPELTGRENIFLNGAILGMSRAEIRKKFDEIVDFAEVEKFLDTPVKRYSSGMYVRLAFAVAAHLEPEILIVDEVLAVGDAQFQKKCLGKMEDVSKNEGRTVLFVSHNMDVVLRLCNKSLILRQGRKLNFGNTEKIVSSYLQVESQLTSRKVYNSFNAPGNYLVKLLSSEVIDVNNINKVNFLINEKIGIKIEIEILFETDDLVLGFNLFNQRDIHILSSHQPRINKQKFNLGYYSAIVWIPENLLAEGIHYCGIAAMSYNPFNVHFHDIKQFAFNVNDIQSDKTGRGEYTGDIPGIVRPKLKWDSIEINKNKHE